MRHVPYNTSLADEACSNALPDSCIAPPSRPVRWGRVCLLGVPLCTLPPFIRAGLFRSRVDLLPLAAFLLHGTAAAVVVCRAVRTEVARRELQRVWFPRVPPAADRASTCIHPPLHLHRWVGRNLPRGDAGVLQCAMDSKKQCLPLPTPESPTPCGMPSHTSKHIIPRRCWV